jgi:cell division protease FtsH
VSYGQEDEPIFLGKEIARHKDYSEETAQRIDRAIKDILLRSQNEAKRILCENKARLEKLSEELLKIETMNSDEVRTLLELPAAACGI